MSSGAHRLNRRLTSYGSNTQQSKHSERGSREDPREAGSRRQKGGAGVASVSADIRKVNWDRTGKKEGELIQKGDHVDKDPEVGSPCT